MLTDINEAIQGQRQGWSLLKKLGEGDAGEVYLAESISDNKPAIVKRPRKGSFFSDSLRQASQISREGIILRGLSRLAFQDRAVRIQTPALVDQNRPEFERTEQTFIVIEQARGLNMKQLSQLIRFGSASLTSLPSDPESACLVQQWSEFTRYPSQLIVRIMLGVLNLLETIHASEIRTDNGTQSGVIWNDVKPEHLYWDPANLRLTVIDWGNSQLLEVDKVTRDRQYTPQDDYRQFIQEMGSFIVEANPGLYDQLEWPGDSPADDVYHAAILPLKTKLESQYELDRESLKALRQQEVDLYNLARLELEHIVEFQQLQQLLAAHGEIPDQFGASNFFGKAAFQMTSENRLEEFQKICIVAARLPSTSTGKWMVLDDIASVAINTGVQDEQTRSVFTNALSAGVAGDWTTALWELFTYLGSAPRPDWWERISQAVRRVSLGLDPDAISPYTMFARLYLTLRAEVTRKGEQQVRQPASLPGNGSQAEEFHWQASENLLATMREEIINKWKEYEPCPPNSGIAYTEADSLVDSIEELLPGSRLQIEKSLSQLKAQVELVMSAWEKKDFELARRGLRLVLVWDPDRLRLLNAYKIIGTAPHWLERVRRGAGKDEPFYDFLTAVELAGRSLRSQVGAASWLDQILEAFKKLRKGTRSVDLMIEYPAITQELPWLSEYQAREMLSLPRSRPLTLERDVVPQTASTTIQGVVDGRFGPGQVMNLAQPLDTWIPEARGSSARVFAGSLGSGKNPSTLAFKIIRPDQMDYALPLFIEEVQVLTLMRDVPGVTPFVECGYLKLAEGQSLPSDESHASADQLSGQVIRYGVEQAQNFLASMDRQLAGGWLPYLALVRQNAEHNLLRYCDAGFNHGWFLSLRESLLLALQICDILQFAHDRNIVYRDHKILHYYWNPLVHGVEMIDWNIARRQPQGLSDEEKQFDLVQFAARGLHHIFTGRPAQGSLPLGPNRPEEIEKASTHYPVNWTYDDERLPNQLRTILEQTLNQGYTQVRQLHQDLLNIFQQLPGTEKTTPGT